MIRKLSLLVAPIALALTAIAAPAMAATTDAAPSSSADECAAVDGVFTAGVADVDISPDDTVRTTTTVNTCDVTTVTTPRVNTAHKNFAVDFEDTTVTRYSTTNVVTENWAVVGQEPSIGDTAWICVNPGGRAMYDGYTWGINSDNPKENAPDLIELHPQCGAALRAFPEVSDNGFTIQQVSEEGPLVDVYDWVVSTDESADDNEQLSFTEDVTGCFNLQSGKYLGSINRHCQDVIDAR